MNLIDTLTQFPALTLTASALLGLVVGSFLNVVAFRVPRMLERQWREQCQDLLELETTEAASESFDLVRPRSRCPHCGQPIRAHENIPVVSYLLLRGRCAHCREQISPRYPLVELLTGALTLTIVWKFGISLEAAAGLVLTWALIALAIIDIDHQLLPDNITLPVLWLGLLVNLFGIHTPLRSAVIGAIAGYLTLWGVYQLFRWATGKEGMGYGDFKLLALLGAWLGWSVLPLIVILSSLLGAVIGGTMSAVRGRDRSTPIPYGPYLAAAGWIALLWGETLTHAYWRWTGMGF